MQKGAGGRAPGIIEASQLRRVGSGEGRDAYPFLFLNLFHHCCICD